jgi:hypothetical protein
MSVSAVSSSVSSDASSAAAGTDRAILVAKKQQDVEKDQAQALIDLVKKSADGVGQLLNVYA